MFKKLMLVFAMSLCFTMFAFPRAEAAADLVYPFDSITIVSAYKFEVAVDAAPATESFLYGQVLVDEVLTIYVGELEMILDETLSCESIILIVTTAGGVDVCRWIVNTYGWLGTDHEMWQFASHITIDPAIGVVKDMVIASQTATVNLIAAATYEFQDNLGATFAMVPGTLLVEPVLDILIAAYAGGGA
ncbi:MAG TPA: hypothetical protein DCR44_02490 [Acholeplasmatales bacterium]|nr:MAG: hypothetical protein A2Y16_06995 [Tenericutes bacterium GWF2_57_13]HAQ56261.1 hypothetical protein [Acholeplasmatales bacterium]